MEIKKRRAFDDAMCAYGDVCDLEKRLCIVSEGKSTLAYETIVMLAERANLQVECAMLNCEDGEPHEHAFISARRPDADGTSRKPWNVARTALNLVLDRKEGRMDSRAALQYYLGQLLDYPHGEILDFIASDIARDCVCDCCGGKREVTK